MLGKKAVSTGWSNLRYIKDNFHDPCYPLSLFNQNDLQKQTKQTPPPPGGVFPEKLGGGVRPAFQNPYPIYDQNLRYSLSYLWPDF